MRTGTHVIIALLFLFLLRILFHLLAGFVRSSILSRQRLCPVPVDAPKAGCCRGLFPEGWRCGWGVLLLVGGLVFEVGYGGLLDLFYGYSVRFMVYASSVRGEW
jgi:hypothetical protein